jgi:hypothetical protein
MKLDINIGILLLVVIVVIGASALCQKNDNKVQMLLHNNYNDCTREKLSNKKSNPRKISRDTDTFLNGRFKPNMDVDDGFQYEYDGSIDDIDPQIVLDTTKIDLDGPDEAFLSHVYGKNKNTAPRYKTSPLDADLEYDHKIEEFDATALQIEKNICTNGFKEGNGMYPDANVRNYCIANSDEHLQPEQFMHR